MNPPKPDIIEFRPQAGKQEMFLSSPADIAIYGGGAGGGKTFGLLLEPLRHIGLKGFGATIFRRSTKDITAQGGLWTESQKIYPYFQGNPRSSNQYLDWRFPKGSEIAFKHLEYDTTTEGYRGAQIPLIGFDQLETFSEYQFWYMFSRNRTTCGIKPYIRATCNPDSESFLRNLIDWWIDNNSGLPIESRAGAIRYFIRQNEDIVFADSKEELIKKYGKEVRPKSLTFIPALLKDNAILREKDPEYIANLQMLPMVERERLLGGNWNVAATGGLCKIEWFNRYDSSQEMPKFTDIVQSWDTAFKDKQTSDYCVCTTWGITADGKLYLLDCYIAKLTFPLMIKKYKELKALYKSSTALIEDKASGQSLVQMIRSEGGSGFIPINPTQDKVTRFQAATIPIESGNVYIPMKAHWLSDFEMQLKSFPKSANDDIVDSVSQFLNWWKNRPNLSIRRL